MITFPYQNSETDDDDISICFSDDADAGSSSFYSTAGGSHDHEELHVSESRRDSSASDCSVIYVEIFKEDVNGLVKAHLNGDDDEDEVEDESKECRICHLSLGIGNGVIELGCDCKNELAIAHSSCAERWFKIRGNRVCEICNSTAESVNVLTELELMQQHSSASSNSTAENVNVLTELELMQQHSSAAIATASVVTAQLLPLPLPLPQSPVAERPHDTISSFCRGHRLLNFLLAFMVFAFVISCIFRFNVTSS